MLYRGNKFLFTNVIADKPISSDEPEQVLNPQEQMELLGERLQEYSEGWNPEYKLTYEKTQEDGKDGYNIHLPYGVDFRIEHGNITFSKFGLSKDELKSVYAYLAQLGISGLSFDPQERDAAFEQAAKEAQQELRNADGIYETSFTSGYEQQPQTPQPANNNQIETSLYNTTGMTEEEALDARRNMAKLLKKNIHAAPIKEEKKVEEVHPSIEDISRYMDTHIRVMQRDKSNTSRKVALGNGYKLMWYKDSDQKNEGPQADKKGKVTPNFDAGLKAEIVSKDGKPYLNLNILTPKYGDAPDWVLDEAMALAAECKVTHLRFSASAAFKGKFIAACGKKMIVPVGIKLKEKEFNVIMKAVKENNDDPKKRAEYYQRLVEQMETDLINMKDRNPNHPYVKMIKTLQIQIAVESSEEKFKRFNNFYEKNVLGKMYTDKSDVPVDLFEIKDKKDSPNAAKDLASGMAYVDLLSEYLKNPAMKDMSDEELQKKYLDFYNKNLYLTHKNLKEKLDGVTASKEVKEVLNREYQMVQKNISSIKSKVAWEGFDKLTLPSMDKYTYYDINAAERNMASRLRAGRLVVQKENQKLRMLPPQRDSMRA